MDLKCNILSDYLYQNDTVIKHELPSFTEKNVSNVGHQDEKLFEKDVKDLLVKKEVEDLSSKLMKIESICIETGNINPVTEETTPNTVDDKYNIVTNLPNYLDRGSFVGQEIKNDVATIRSNLETGGDESRKNNTVECVLISNHLNEPADSNGKIKRNYCDEQNGNRIIEDAGNLDIWDEFERSNGLVTDNSELGKKSEVRNGSLFGCDTTLCVNEDDRERKHQCEICGKKFAKLSVMKRHRLGHDTTKAYLCDLCGRAFSQPMSLKYHRFNHLRDKLNEKGRVTLTKSSYNGGEPSKPFLCDVCGKCYSQAITLKIHKKKHSISSSTESSKLDDSLNDEQYIFNGSFRKKKCKSTKTQGTAQKKSFKCSECPYAASRSRDVHVHMRTHTGAKPFPCGICGKWFSKESVVKRHQLIHSGVRPHICSLCGKSFTQAGNLKSHMSNHVGKERINDLKGNLNCKSDVLINSLVQSNTTGTEYCTINQIDTRFISEQVNQFRKEPTNNLGNDTASESETHNTVPRVIRIEHSPRSYGVRKVKAQQKVVISRPRVRKKHFCDECPYSTSSFRDMTVHRRKHTGERPFPCPICGKRFSKQSVVKRHQSVHTGLKPFYCEICGKSFSQASNMKSHKISHFDETTGLPIEARTTKEIVEVKNNEIRHFYNAKRCPSKNDTFRDNTLVKKINISKFEVPIEDKTPKETSESGHVYETKRLPIESKTLKDISCGKEISRLSDNVKTLKKFAIKGENNRSDSGIEECNFFIEPDDYFETDVDFDTDFGCNYDEKLVSYDSETVILVSNSPIDKENSSVVKQSKSSTLVRHLEFKDQDTLGDILKCEETMKTRRKKVSKRVKEIDRVSKGNLLNSFENKINITNVNLQTDLDSETVVKVEYGNLGESICLSKEQKESTVEGSFYLENINKNESINKRKLKGKNKRKLVRKLINMLDMNNKKGVSVGDKKCNVFYCNECDYTVSNKRDLTVHIRSHTKEKLYECDICFKRFAKQNVVKRHKLIHSGERNFACLLCEKRFTQSSGLKAHMAKHVTVKQELPYVCETCGNSFAQEKSLKNHRHVHRREKTATQFACQFCGKIFSYECRLKAHLIVHSGEKKFQCDLCDKKFLRIYDMKYHKLLHTQEKLFICDTCGKAYSTPTTLKLHKRTHSGEKPYVCHICGVSFARPGHLGRHKISHTGLKAYSCSICEKSFTQASGLKKHLVIHSGERAFSCEICGKAFKLMTHLRKHLKHTKHSSKS